MKKNMNQELYKTRLHIDKISSYNLLLGQKL